MIGHRGACAFLPENTKESFRLAFEQGAYGIEFDVHASRDGVPVIVHDATFNRTTNAVGYINRFRVQDLKKLDAGFQFDPQKNKTYPYRKKNITVPLFEELLEEFKTQQLCVEMKECAPELTRKVVGLIKRYGAESRCIVGSKHFSVSETMRTEFPEIRRFLSKREFVSLFMNYKTGNGDPEKDPGAVASMPIEACGLAFGNKDFIEYLHRLKITVCYWTVNNPIVMKELAKRGADMIITDNPALALKTFSS